jgi:hypothetical protein
MAAPAIAEGANACSAIDPAPPASRLVFAGAEKLP